MIARLRGTLLEKSTEHVVVDCSGVGYFAACSARSIAECPEPGAAVDLMTHLVVREDAMALYGFTTELEREAFRLLLAVSGVGPRLGMAILSGLSPDELCDAVVHADLARFKGISGVGKKTAERVVLELKGERIGKLQALSAARPGGAAAGVTRRAGGDGAARTLEELRSALENLGYRPGEVERGLDAVRVEATRGTPVAALLREALQAVRAPR
jgi:holliday junction DNA helicase RuvA